MLATVTVDRDYQFFNYGKDKINLKEHELAYRHPCSSLGLLLMDDRCFRVLVPGTGVKRIVCKLKCILWLAQR